MAPAETTGSGPEEALRIQMERMGAEVEERASQRARRRQETGLKTSDGPQRQAETRDLARVEAEMMRRITQIRGELRACTGEARAERVAQIHKVLKE